MLKASYFEPDISSKFTKSSQFIGSCLLQPKREKIRKKSCHQPLLSQLKSGWYPPDAAKYYINLSSLFLPPKLNMDQPVDPEKRINNILVSMCGSHGDVLLRQPFKKELAIQHQGAQSADSLQL